ncbi:MAG: type II secretion system GspH family protein [Planctomycetes bacterium]|jgi:hypothetical protein|nr:type II secretion system GspH family protein [Planctomycetota bacterium]MCU0727928.1 type II secretion system GspH family protein [Planctomycetota bacterium]
MNLPVRARRRGFASLIELLVSAGLLAGLASVLALLARDSLVGARRDAERLSASDAASRAFSRLEEDAFRSTDAAAEGGGLAFTGPAGRVDYRVEDGRLLRVEGGRTQILALRVASARFAAAGDGVVRARLEMRGSGRGPAPVFESSLHLGGRP